MAPRPILKSLPKFQRFSAPLSSSSSFDPLPFPSSRPDILSPHVHFPPTPVLVSTQPTHSSSSYDRSAIAVSPNSCELPERGDRFYSPGHVHYTLRTVSDYFDPLAFRTCSVFGDAPPPPLVPDTGTSSESSSCSESDDSDSYASPVFSSPSDMIPFSPTHTTTTPSFRSLPSTYVREDFAHALSFLPHPRPPSPLLKDTLVKDRSRHRLGPPTQKKFGKKERRGCEMSMLGRSDSSFQEQNLDGCLGGF
jgi:hypothetical protein